MYWSFAVVVPHQKRSIGWIQLLSDALYSSLAHINGIDFRQWMFTIGCNRCEELVLQMLSHIFPVMHVGSVFPLFMRKKGDESNLSLFTMKWSVLRIIQFIVLVQDQLFVGTPRYLHWIKCKVVKYPVCIEYRGEQCSLPNSSFIYFGDPHSHDVFHQNQIWKSIKYELNSRYYIFILSQKIRCHIEKRWNIFVP